MIRSLSIALAALFLLGLVVNMGKSQDTKMPAANEPDKKGTKGQLPQGWKKLNLTGNQKQKIYEIIKDYRPKIKSLEEQIVQLKSQEHLDLLKVLTDAQKAELAKGLVPDDPKKDQPKDDKKPDDKK